MAAGLKASKFMSGHSVLLVCIGCSIFSLNSLVEAVNGNRQSTHTDAERRAFAVRQKGALALSKSKDAPDRARPRLLPNAAPSERAILGSKDETAKKAAMKRFPADAQNVGLESQEKPTREEKMPVNLKFDNTQRIYDKSQSERKKDHDEWLTVTAKLKVAGDNAVQKAAAHTLELSKVFEKVRESKYGVAALRRAVGDDAVSRVAHVTKELHQFRENVIKTRPPPANTPEKTDDKSDNKPKTDSAGTAPAAAAATSDAPTDQAPKDKPPEATAAAEQQAVEGAKESVAQADEYEKQLEAMPKEGQK